MTDRFLEEIVQSEFHAQEMSHNEIPAMIEKLDNFNAFCDLFNSL